MPVCRATCWPICCMFERMGHRVLTFVIIFSHGVVYVGWWKSEWFFACCVKACQKYDSSTKWRHIPLFQDSWTYRRFTTMKMMLCREAMWWSKLCRWLLDIVDCWGSNSLKTNWEKRWLWGEWFDSFFGTFMYWCVLKVDTHLSTLSVCSICPIGDFLSWIVISNKVLVSLLTTAHCCCCWKAKYPVIR